MLRIALALSLLVVPHSVLSAQEWGSPGGDSSRSGRSAGVGPTTAGLRWSHSYAPVEFPSACFISGGRVHTVRVNDFPIVTGGAIDDPVLAYDLDTGALLWSNQLPFGGDPDLEGSAKIGGVNGGRVFVTRADSINGGPILALDAATGDAVWQSTNDYAYVSGPGLVFTDDGDLILGTVNKIARIDGATGVEEWSYDRFCLFNACGPVLGPDGVYGLEGGLFGAVFFFKLDLLTGTFLYRSANLFGANSGNSPIFSATNSTLYIQTTDQLPNPNNLVATQDTGTTLQVLWTVPTARRGGSFMSLTEDGDVYDISVNLELARFDQATGAIVEASQPIYSSGLIFDPEMAVDVGGTVYVMNGSSNNPDPGQVIAFDASLATTLFTVDLLNSPNFATMALGGTGTLVILDTDGISAYRCPTDAAVAVRTNASNPDSYSADPLIVGTEWNASVDLGGTTGHGFAVVVGFLSPATFTLPGGGQVVLTNIRSSAGEQLGLAPAFGPTALFNASVPPDPNLCGTTVYTQAAHLGSVTPFALSNAQDLTIGY